MTALTRADRAKFARKFKQYAAIQELLNNLPQLRQHAQYTDPEYHGSLTESDIRELMSDKPERMPKSERLEWAKKVSSTLICHVDTMITRWEASCDGTWQGRLKRRIIRKFYFEYGNTLASIAVMEDKPKAVIEQYHIKALKELSALIFGTDGLLKVDGAMYMLHLEAGTLRPHGG
ncbi:hypothetical protein FACS1894217_05670 [Clostridia bacterium]|nr:hypothetical protein FACS1894217_05670 [Clostridia bacterium]